MERGLLTIESIAAGGDGVAHADGLAVFVPRTAPGDVAQVEWSAGRRFARGSLLEIVEPSRDRVVPPCAHYVNDRCGGCQLQHMEEAAQRSAKSRIVADAFERIAHRTVPAPVVAAGPSPWRYRRKLTLALRRRGGAWIAGLHPFDAPGRVFALHDCLITDARVVEAWHAIMEAAPLLPRAAALRGAVRLAAAGPELLLEGGREWRTHAAFFERVRVLAALWWTPEGAPARALHARQHDAGAGTAFAQVNAAVAAALRNYVVARIEAHDPRMIVDAYAGTGELSAALARPERRVTAIELNEGAARLASARLPEGSRSIAARVEDALPDALPADVVALNPPRAGVDARVTRVLEGARGVRAVLYVSCDPATLARDVARLPAWRVASLAAFDMFPQTAHVETVCELVPAA